MTIFDKNIELEPLLTVYAYITDDFIGNADEVNMEDVYMSCCDESGGESGEEFVLPEGLVLGDNGACGLNSSGSKVLDLFFQLVPHVEQEHAERLLEAAWEENSLDTLKIIFQTGNARQDEGGKMDRPNFYMCLLWLWREKPETLLLNVDKIAAHGCLKDLLEIVTIACKGTLKEDGSTLSKDNGSTLSKENKVQMGLKISQKILIRMNKHQRRAARIERRMKIKNEFSNSCMEQSEWDVNERWKRFVKDRDADCAAVISKNKKEKQREIDSAVELWRCGASTSELNDDVILSTLNLLKFIF
jgi:hypothetical protein